MSWLGNVELRFPVFGVFGIGSGYYGVLPLDLHVFGDGGIAWDSDEDPSFAGGDREPGFSALRLPLQSVRLRSGRGEPVRPFDRPA
jgi:hypothetical protein